MIRVLLEHGHTLYREALSAALSWERDLQVVRAVVGLDQVPAAAVRDRPDVAVLASPPTDRLPAEKLCGLPARAPPECGLLMVLDRHTRYGPVRRLAKMAPRVGIVAAECSLEELVTGVRSLARGEPVLDVGLVVAALTAQASPLTERECELLRLVMTGATTQEVARRLGLSTGTVRNYLSHILMKTGARSRIEAIRIAQDAGWI